MQTKDQVVSDVRPFRFESFGVKIEITGSSQELVDEAETVARRALLGNVKTFAGDFDHKIEVHRTPGRTLRLFLNGERIASGRSRKKFFKFLDGIIRITVGEFAVDRVFIHAGAVSWKGKAIIIPGDSFKGKSTLVAELVRNGAEYYSDDFAIFDKDGFLHPFPRDLAMRRDSTAYKEYILTPEDLGGRTGTAPIPIGMVLVTAYSPGAKWKPEILTAGQGVMEMLPHTLSLRHRPDFAVMTLNNVARGAIIARSLRGTAEKFVKILLNFVDKHEI